MITARASFFLWLLGYQESCMGTSSSCKLLHVCIGRFLALLLFVVVIPDLLQEAQTRRITFTEAPAKYTSNTSVAFCSNLTSAANGSGSSIDTCATLCSIRCKVGRHFVDALVADQVSRLASYFCTPLSSSCKPWELLLLLLLLHSQRFDKHFGLFMSPTCT
ncbi:unnamed protein product [Sphagnum troendelagicum]